jgi:hypothetical protein
VARPNVADLVVTQDRHNMQSYRVLDPHRRAVDVQLGRPPLLGQLGHRRPACAIVNVLTTAKVRPDHGVMPISVGLPLEVRRTSLALVVNPANPPPLAFAMALGR